MDPAAGGGMLTACLAVGALLIRLGLRSDAAARRRYPHQPEPPQPLPRDPHIRTAAEQRDLFTRQPSAPDTEPRDDVPAQPQDARPPRPEPIPHRPGPRSTADLRDLFEDHRSDQ